MTRSEMIFKTCRDFVLLAIGAGGIVHQEYTGQPLPALLAVYTTLLGLPGASALLALLKRPTESPSRSPASPASPPESLPSSTK